MQYWNDCIIINFKLINYFQVKNHFVEKDKTYLHYINLKIRGNSRTTYPIPLPSNSGYTLI